MSGVDAEVVVVGLGAWGSAALWRLAERGVDVLGVDAHPVPHPLGSSHGHTRLFRVACHEHVGLTAVAHRARDLWYELGGLAGVELLHQTGCLSIGPAGGRAIGTTSRAVELAGMEVDHLDVDELRRRYPQHAELGDHYVGLFDPEAGYVAVETSITAALDRARSLGARLRTGTAVTDVVDDGDGVLVRTAGATVRARQVVLAAGPWMAVLQDLVTLTPYRAPMLWWEAATDPEAFGIERFPAFIRHYDDQNTLWGHGSTGSTPVKLGLSNDPRSKRATHPDRLDRSIRPDRDTSSAEEIVRWAVPGLRPRPVEVAPCMITESPDLQFVIGRHPGRPHVLLAGGCSGHGFKHAAAIGELLAQTATGEDLFADVDFMDPRRFA